MKRLTLLAAALISLGAAAQTLQPKGTVVKASDSNIQYVGRIVFNNPDSPMFGYPGTMIRSGFNGTSLKMIAKPNSGYFMAKIDNAEPFKVAFNSKKDSIVSLATALPEGTHQVQLMYISEGYDRKPEFRGFIVDEGKTLAPAPQLPSRRIEFIGNSITCGYGIEALNGDARYEEETANHYYTYAAKAARNLNAQHIAVARSGFGVYRNYNGPRTGDKINMNTEYTHTICYDSTYEWDFSRFTPDVVCINLGTNDTSTTGADPKLLLKGFTDLYDKVRAHYPSAKIVLLSGSMMRGKEDLPMAKKALDETVKYAANRGDKEVYRFDFAPQDGKLGFGASHHPSYYQHEKMAGELTSFLRNLMNWW